MTYMDTVTARTRVKSLIESIFGLVLLFGYIWWVYSVDSILLKSVTIILIIAFLSYCTISHKESLKVIGFRFDNWRYPLKLNLIFIIIVIPLLCGVWSLFFPIDTTFYKSPDFWQKMSFEYPFSAFFQQYLFFGFFYRRYTEVFPRHKKLAILLSAITFSVAHVPNPTLMLLCFIAGLVWAKIYSTETNIFSNAISHMILASFVMGVLGASGRIGPTANPWMWSKSQEITAVILSVNSNDNRIVNINPEIRNIIVRGAISNPEKIKKAWLVFNEKKYPIIKPDYINDSWDLKQIIPLHDIGPGNYILYIKALVKGENINDYLFIGRKITIRKMSRDSLKGQLDCYSIVKTIIARKSDKDKYVITNTDIDYLESLNIKTIELNNVFNEHSPQYFKDALNFIKNQDKGYEVFIIIREKEKTISNILQPADFNKFLIQLAQNKNENGDTITLYLYRNDKSVD